MFSYMNAYLLMHLCLYSGNSKIYYQNKCSQSAMILVELYIILFLNFRTKKYHLSKIIKFFKEFKHLYL